MRRLWSGWMLMASAAACRSDQVQEIALGGIENDRALARLDTVKFAKAPAEAMAQTLDYLDRRYGGVKGYLCAVGFRADAQNRLFRALSAPLRSPGGPKL